MFGFGKSKEKSRDIDASFDRLRERVRQIDDWENPKKLERYILDSCEQIIGSTREIEAAKAEYRMLTNSLEDIQRLARMPEKRAKEIGIAAETIATIQTSRRQFEQAPREVTDKQIRVLSECENDMPQIIARMEENERQQDEAKKKVRQFEARKGEIEVERDSYGSGKRRLRMVSILLMLLLASVMVFLFVLGRLVYTIDLRPFYTILFLICAIAGMGVLLYQMNMKNRRGVLVRELNKTIAALNIARMQYANVTRAVKYQQEKFEVQSAAQLTFVYEKYQNYIRRMKAYDKDSDDLEYWNRKLLELLSSLELSDAKIWLERYNALSDSEIMENVQKDMVDRRKKVREMIQENTKGVKSERDEIDRLMKEHDYYVPEILEIISSVDRLCGLDQAAAA